MLFLTGLIFPFWQTPEAKKLRLPLMGEATCHRGMLFHIHIPFSVFFVSIGKFSDLCHQTHFGL